MKLTPKQKAIYLFIRREIYAGRVPSIREIMTEFKFASTSGVVCHLDPLKKKGLIDWESDQSRTIRLLQEPLVFGLDNEIYSFSDLFQEGNVLTREGEVKRNGVVIATVMKVGHP